MILGEDLLKEKLNLIYNVGKGSSHAPALINLYYNGNSSDDSVIAFIGKGILFDSGGYNIKTSMMELMYMDKCGAMNVLCAFLAIVELKLPVFNIFNYYLIFVNR